MITRRTLLKATVGAAGIAAVPTIQSLKLEPDDAIVFNSPDLLDDEARREVELELRYIFGEDRKIIVVDGGAFLSKVKA